MKIRNGWVSNSSSSSFVLYKDKVTQEQIAWVKNPLLALNYLRQYYKDYILDEDDCFEQKWFDEWCFDYSGNIGDLNAYKEWTVTKDNDSVFAAETFMNNFDYDEFCRIIGIPVEAYKCWGD